MKPCIKILISCILFLLSSNLDAQKLLNIKKNCNIDSIRFREYSIFFPISDTITFTRIDSILKYGKYKKNWLMKYKDNILISQLMGDTYGGQDRERTFIYDNNLLVRILDNGNFKENIEFEYNEKGIPKTIVNSSIIFKKSIFNLSFNNDSLNVIYNNGVSENPEIYNIKLNKKYKDKCLKAGNIDFLDDELGFPITDYENDNYFKVEKKYDNCKNLISYIVRNRQSNKILLLKNYDLYYSK